MNTSQSHDILAKLLATENVSVVRENVTTASFDIKNRVLRLPRWKELSPEVEEMLILHEVGHALYTTPEVYGQLYEDRAYLKDYANVIEDVRIEKKMKERYPGSRKTFNIGYTELNSKDFFGVKGRDLNDALLIDKINVYYKVGYNAGVPFSAEEYVFVQKADKCVTEEDVLDLAEEIFAYSKAEKQKEQKQNEQYKSSAGNEDGEYEDGDFDGTERSEDINSDNFDDKSLAPKTTDNFDDKLSDLQDRESRTYYFEPKFEVETESPIVDYKKVLEQLTSRFNEESLAFCRKKSTEFKSSSTNVVNYLVKEFEMRKSASAYKRTKISRLGQLDTRKLFAYKLKDDIFKQIATVQEGKKHGMIFLLDWSGSMSTYIRETVEQVINLAMFCRKINIPFQVFAFSDGYGHARLPIVKMPGTNNPNGLGSMQAFSLLELFSHKMNTRDFNQMIDMLLNDPWRHKDYNLNGTPLNDSLLYMIDYIGKFIGENQVEKMTFITLTDGESNNLSHYNFGNRPTYGIKNGKANVDEDGVRVLVNAKSIMRDHVTRKEYLITDSAPEQTSVLLNMIRDRYAIRSVGFYILNPRLSDMERFVKTNMPQITRNPNIYRTAVELQSKLRHDKSIVSKDIPGRDEMYLLASTNKIEDEDIDDVTQDMSASQISKQLGKMFTSRKGSRVVLSSFIGMAA
jgi:hypothetical protein